MALAEIKVEIPRAAADAVEDRLLELGEVGWSLREDALAGRAWIVGIFSGAAEARARWAELARSLPARPSGPPALRALAKRDWARSYRAHFRAWHCGRLHWAPVWERGRFRPPPGGAVLWLDPGLAFGTGNHETTRLCCERLVRIAARAPGRWSALSLTRSTSEKLAHHHAARVLDVGCGSGILALSAVRLGFRDVAGFDCDPLAVRVSRENAARNRLGRRVKFFQAGLPEGLRGRPADVLLANIQADVLMRHARPLAAAVAPGGMLVLSGILAGERAAVRAAFAAAAPGWKTRSRTRGEWCDLAMTREAK